LLGARQQESKDYLLGSKNGQTQKHSTQMVLQGVSKAIVFNNKKQNHF